MTLTKSDIDKVKAIKIDVDHFGYTLLEANINEDESLTMTLVKTSEYKKHNKDHNKVDTKFLRVETIKLYDTENPLYFKENVINLSNSLLRIINILKTGK